MGSSHAHKHEAHGSMSVYLTVFVVLIILTIASFSVANWTYLRDTAPGVMWAFMMAVSTAKAMLVIMFFMHLKWEANWKYVLTIPCCIMSLFLVLMLIPDIGRRTKYYSEDRWTYSSLPGEHSQEEGGPDSPEERAASSH